MNQVCTALTLGLLCCVLSAGIAIASALIDTSQQKPMDFKEKSQGLKNRKALPPAHQGTCVWIVCGLGGLSFTRATSSLVLLRADGGLERLRVRGLFRWQSALYFHSTYTISPRQIDIVRSKRPCHRHLASFRFIQLSSLLKAFWTLRVSNGLPSALHQAQMCL